MENKKQKADTARHPPQKAAARRTLARRLSMPAEPANDTAATARIIAHPGPASRVNPAGK